MFSGSGEVGESFQGFEEPREDVSGAEFWVAPPPFRPERVQNSYSQNFRTRSSSPGQLWANCLTSLRCSSKGINSIDFHSVKLKNKINI